ncbi:MAG: type VI secretion system baseplate subunit TssF [Holosporales bacterium]|jgi:type VI secretion system protein ImpG|nr:type VI secretion system baseplate subunit TssF [Holosporales bacterium]
MSEKKKFLNYYKDELLFLREKGGAFAKSHPDIADKLDLKDGESSDPHTERIIESVAFMAAGLSQKIDDNAQYIAFHLLSALYPSLINTFPPFGIVRYSPKSAGAVADKIHIPKATKLSCNSRAGVSCTFRTVYPLDIYPISITDTQITRMPSKFCGPNKQAIEIKIQTESVPIEKLNIQTLLFSIDSEIVEDALLIYEAIFANPMRVVVLDIKGHYVLVDDENIVQCGFSDDEAICPVHKYSNNVFQLFQEVLHFRRKFMFFKILGIGKMIENSGLKDIDEFSILIEISPIHDRLSEIVKKGAIAINTVPIVNLFPITSDPFRFDGTKNKYLLMADQSLYSSLEIHSILNVRMLDHTTKEEVIIQPYFALSIDSADNVIHDTYWTYSREPVETKGLGGYDTYISFVETNLNPEAVYWNVVYAQTLCTNRFAARDIPSLTNMHTENIETGSYVAKLTHRMTKPVTMSEESATLWKLISHLAATHISMAVEENILAGISKLLAIFAGKSEIKTHEVLNQITQIKTNRIVRRIGTDAWRGFVTGIEVLVYISNEDYSHHIFLICCVLNQFLSSSISINSFIELRLILEANGKTLAHWPPTSGRKDLM